MGNRVLISIEADVGRFARAHRAHDVGLEGVHGEGKQPGLFLRAHVGDRPVPAVQDGAADARCRPASGENCALRSSRSRNGRAAKNAWRRYWIWRSTFPFSFAAGRRTGAGRNVRVPRELEQAWVKLNRRAPSIEHSTAEIVVHQGPGTPVQRLEGGDVPAEETLERLVQREQREESPRVAQDHHEARDRAHAMTDADRAKGAPVDLCLPPAR